MIDEQDLAAYLTSKGVQVYRAAGSEVTAHCMFCDDGDPKGKGKLYLNTETWLWDCKRCGVKGNRRTLLEHYGDQDALKHVVGSDPGTHRRILQEATELAHEMLLGNDAMAEYLLARGIHEDLIVSQKLGFVPRNFGLTGSLPSREQFTVKDLVGAGLLSVGGREFFGHSLLIPYWSHGSVVQIREKQIDGKYRTPAGAHVRLYNSDALHGAAEVIITEGEYDCLALMGALHHSGDRRLASMAVVGVPGAGSWPEGFAEMLSNANRVFIGFDPDETGHIYSNKLAEQIGGKARIVRLPEGLPKVDWSDYLSKRTLANPGGGKTWRDVNELLIEADLAGKRLFTITDAALKWRKAKLEGPGLKFGWPSLDAVMRPGLKPGQVMIPLARTGTGKTAFLSNIAHNMRKEGVLYISLEMTASEVYEHLHRIHHFWNPFAGEAEMADDYEGIQIVERNRIGRGDVKEYINEYVESTGVRPKVVLLDYLQYFARGFPGTSMHEKSSDATMELKAVAKEESVAMIAPSQANRTGEAGKPLSLEMARDSGVIEDTADFMVSLYRPDQILVDGEQIAASGSFNLGMLKSRHGGSGRTFNLLFSPLSLVMVDKLDRAETIRVEQENSLARQGTHYDDYRKLMDDSNAQRTLRGVG